MKLWLKWQGREFLLGVLLLSLAAFASLWFGGYIVKTPGDFETLAVETCSRAASKAVVIKPEDQPAAVLPLGNSIPYASRRGVVLNWKNLEGDSSVTCWVYRVRGKAFVEKLEVNGINRLELVDR